MSNSLGVFYTCYKEKTAVEESLREFRKHYPTAPVYLISDGGLDFSYLESELNIKTTVKPEGMGYSKNMRAVIASGNIDYDQLMKESYEFLNRIYEACHYCKSSHLLLMEPDVWVRGPLTLSDLEDLKGPVPNRIPDGVLALISANEGDRTVKYFGASAGILKVSSFCEVYHQIRYNPLVLRTLLHADPSIVNYDYLLTVLFAYYGFNYKCNQELTECIRNPEWETSGHPLLHQHRKYYGSNEGKHG